MGISKSLTRSEMAIINLLTSALAWAWPVLLSFITSPIIVRKLGNDAYGIRSLVISITGYFALLDLGLNGAVTKFLAEYYVIKDKARITKLLGTTLTTYIVFGIIGGSAIWLLAGWFTTHLFKIPPQYYQQSIMAFQLSGIGFFLSMISWWGSSVPTGIQRFDVFNGISISFGTITTITTLAAVLLGYGLVGVVLANIFSNLVAIVLYFYYIRVLLPNIPIRLSFDRDMFKITILFGLYMLLFRIFGLVFSQLDSMFIGAWISVAAITFYTVPTQVAQMVHGVNSKMMQIIFPMASEFSATGDQQNLDRLFFRGFNLSLVIGLAIAIPLAVVANPLLRFWMSPDIAKNSTIVLELLIFTFLLTGLTAHTTSFLSGLNYPQFVTLGSVVSGLFGISFYILLIKPLGVNGAALAKLISIIITIIYYFVVCKIKARVRVNQVFKVASLPVILSIVIGTPIAFFITPKVTSLIITMFVAALTASLFVTACWLANVFNAEEKQSLKQLANKTIHVVIHKEIKILG